MITAAKPMTMAPRPALTSANPWYWEYRALDSATIPLEIISPKTLLRLTLIPWARLMLGLAPVARMEQPISVPKNQYRITMMAAQKMAPHRMGLLYQG